VEFIGLAPQHEKAIRDEIRASTRALPHPRKPKGQSDRLPRRVARPRVR
jgi:hypothetical protein